jgi:hypothetical protein
MLSDIEELARDGMRDFTATMHASPDLAARAHAQHKRRRLTAYASAAGAVGAAGAAAAVVVSVALPAGSAGVAPPAGRVSGSHPTASNASRSPGIQLAAWTVIRETNGDIKVTFREATNIAGLQRTLRGDGIPASVTFAGQQNSACRPYHPAGGSRAYWPFGPGTGPFDGKRFMHDARAAFDSPYALVIDPSAVPSGAGVQIMVSGTPGAADNFSLNMDLVEASQQCTGS